MPKFTLRNGLSSSLMSIVASLLVPPVTALGRVPKPSFTDSSSSSTVSWRAVKLKNFSVSPLRKTTVRGTPE